MQFNTYGGTGSFLTVDLLNASDHHHATLSEILRTHAISYPDVDAGQANRISAWVERLRPVFGDPDASARSG